MRKVYVNVTTKIIMSIDENITVDDILQEMDYNFYSPTDKCDFLDTEIIDWKITDSK